MEKTQKNGKAPSHLQTPSILSPEEIEMIYSFCKIFMDDEQRIDLAKMLTNMQSTEEFNVEVVKRILVWMRRNTKSESNLKRR